MQRPRVGTGCALFNVSDSFYLSGLYDVLHRESPLENLGGLKEVPLRKGGEGVVK